MRTPHYRTEVLVELFKEQTVATLPQLKKALGTAAPMTVFRKLKQIGAQSSYSHRGQYYGLVEDMDFDAHGLWAFGAIRFSEQGTLLATAEALVHRAPAGYFSRELEALVQVGVKEALLKLFRQTRVTRCGMFGRHLYCSPQGATRQAQILARQQQTPELPTSLTHEQQAGLVLFLSLLDEKQRRLYAGLESLKFGRGGDQAIAHGLHLDVHTVARGRRELLSGEVERTRVRKPGAGRAPVKKKRQKSSTPSTNSSSARPRGTP